VSIAAPKIILHSDQSIALTAERDQELIRSLSGKRSPRIGYIPSTPDRRRKYFFEKEAYYQKIGFAGLQYFDPAEGLSELEMSAFFSLDVIHLAGGEVVPFMHSLRNSGCDARLRAFAERGGLMLGVSAGAMLLGKTFSSVSLFGEQGVFDGMGFFDFEVVPHVSEKFPRLDILRDFAKRQKKTLYALNDGDVVVVSGKKIRTYGSVVKIDRPIL